MEGWRVTRLPHELGPVFWCPNCGRGLSVKIEQACDAFFNGGEDEPCPKCGEPAGIDSLVFSTLKGEAYWAWVYNAIGARITFHSLDLEVGQKATLSFAEIGVPPDATVLSISYSPRSQRAPAPVELHASVPTWRPPTERVHLLGTRSHEGCSRGEVGCAVSWFLPPDEDDGWSHLLEAFRAFSHNDQRNVIVPANIAAEMAISAAVSEGLVTLELGSKGSVNRFLSESGAGYSHKKKFLLPMVADLFEYPRLPTPTLGKLNSLRVKRNTLVHEGTFDAIHQSELAELLRAALFGFHYGRLLRKRIARSRHPTTDHE